MVASLGDPDQEAASRRDVVVRSTMSPAGQTRPATYSER